MNYFSYKHRFTSLQGITFLLEFAAMQHPRDSIIFSHAPKIHTRILMFSVYQKGTDMFTENRIEAHDSLSLLVHVKSVCSPGEFLFRIAFDRNQVHPSVEIVEITHRHILHPTILQPCNSGNDTI